MEPGFGSEMRSPCSCLGGYGSYKCALGYLYANPTSANRSALASSLEEEAGLDGHFHDGSLVSQGSPSYTEVLVVEVWR